MRLTGLVTLTLPHPGAVAQNMRRQPRQLWRSRYVLFFQFKAAANRAVRADNFAYVDKLWRRWSPGFRRTPERVVRIKEALAPSWPGPLEHYRGGGFGGGSPGCIDVPWLHLMGADDGCTLPGIGEGQSRFAGRTFEQHLVEGAGHFLHLEAPDIVARYIEGLPLDSAVERTPGARPTAGVIAASRGR